MANRVAIKFRAAVRRMLSRRFTNSNLPAAIDRGAAAYRSRKPRLLPIDRQMFWIVAAGSTRASATDATHPRFNSRAYGRFRFDGNREVLTKRRRSGGEYPRATTVFRKCEIATITAGCGHTPDRIEMLRVSRLAGRSIRRHRRLAAAQLIHRRARRTIRAAARRCRTRHRRRNIHAERKQQSDKNYGEKAHDHDRNPDRYEPQQHRRERW